MCRGRESSGTPHNERNRTGEREASTDRQWTRVWFLWDRERSGGGAFGARRTPRQESAKSVSCRVAWWPRRQPSSRECRARSYGHIERKQNLSQPQPATTRFISLESLYPPLPTAPPQRLSRLSTPHIPAHACSLSLTPAPAPAPDCYSQQSGPPRSQTPPHSGYRVRAPDPALGRWLTDRSRTRQEASR